MAFEKIFDLRFKALRHDIGILQDSKAELSGSCFGFRLQVLAKFSGLSAASF